VHGECCENEDVVVCCCVSFFVSILNNSIVINMGNLDKHHLYQPKKLFIASYSSPPRSYSYSKQVITGDKTWEDTTVILDDTVIVEGTLTIINSTVLFNSPTERIGIVVDESGTLYINDSQLLRYVEDHESYRYYI